MPTAIKTKVSTSGIKRKAETIKVVSSKRSKKPNIDSIPSLKPNYERNISSRPEKANAAGKRLIAGALGLRVPKETPNGDADKVVNIRKEKVTKTSSPIVRMQTQGDSSDDEFNGIDEDGGVVVGHSVDPEESGELQPTDHQGIHPDRVKANKSATGPNGTSSREAHAKQKQLIAERKASKPLAEQLSRSKKIWERLRRKSHVPLEERKNLVEELFEIITGKVKDFVLKHDSVRVVQTAIKYANREQKRLIAKELQGTYRQLAESRYAKFLIGKLLVQGDDEIRDIIVPEFFGNVRRLIRHPEASWILDDVYRGIATGQQKVTILREWYGAEFSLFQNGNDKISGDLTDILAIDSGKRAPIMRYLHEMINHLIQKSATAFTLLHDAMLQYFLNCKPGTEEITEFIELIKGDEGGDLLKNLAFTKSGARVVCIALAYGTAKDRKHILKAYKDTIQMMAADPNAHVIILTAYEVIDDTVLTSKSIFSELLSKDPEKQVENIVQASNELAARTTLLYLFQGRSSSLFPANLSSDLAILSEVDKIRSSTSKKDPETRRLELAKALSPYLLAAITSAASQFVVTSFGCQFVTEVLFGAEGDKSSALKAIASTAAGDPDLLTSEGADAQTEDTINTHNTAPQLHITQNPFGGKMLKALIAGGRYDPKLKKVISVLPPLNFADILYPIIKPHIITWATASSSFVMLSLLETKHFSSKKELLGILKGQKKALQKAAAEEMPKLNGDVKEKGEEKGKGKGKSKGKEPKEKPVGNLGTKLILEMLD